MAGLLTVEEANDAVRRGVARATAAGRLDGGLAMLDHLAAGLGEGESYDAARLQALARDMREQAT